MKLLWQMIAKILYWQTNKTSQQNYSHLFHWAVPSPNLSNWWRPSKPSAAFISLVLAVMLLSACAEKAEQAEALPALQISSGEIIGSYNSLGGRQWRGIPYAEPPIGDLRWRAPQKIKPWDEARITQEHGPSCTQTTSGTVSASADVNGLIGQEDCLYLNVYSPKDADNLAVMVWVHGGSNTHGAADIYDGSRLAVENNVIVVTLNYRLGALGWFRHPALAHEEETLGKSGNFGTLDILTSLQWVQANIQAFGGDPDRVTLFGESAGGFNTLSLMLSPLAKNLFHRAIVQSGGLWFDDIATATAYPEDGGSDYSALEIERQLRMLNGWSLGAKATRSLIEQEKISARAEFLREVRVEDIFTAYDHLGNSKPDIPRVFRDGTVISSADPITDLTDIQRHNNVPVIIGSNRDELKLYYYQDPKYVDLYFNRYAIIKDLPYYNARAQYHSERWKYQGVDRIAEALSKADGEKVWAYRFDWDEQARPLGMKLDQLLGASHGMEIPFVFGFTDSGGLFDPMINRKNTAGREQLSKIMRGYWAHFAKTGSPNHQQQKKWLSWAEQQELKQYALFDTTDLMHSDKTVIPESFYQRIIEDSRFKSDQQRCEVWASLIHEAPTLWLKSGYNQSNRLDCSEHPFEKFYP
ncbi:carboxylesterase family protein [uncultured Pseudoteredinibacter sp.]|uniref:carboxylesterase/lipase family protein n=1 Tax=uncultured Pseudoteredinibacter sp. TaxID=1641701 RepID=UPI0026297AAB|nr:carboxylesterase family protein [uncultured Pseudoteredinibacter sp.]